ncbi:hypothetical protein AXG93_698s1090 [Marchantia polymorpha subsp. ruderalis]|uniref:SSUH2-like protein n=1 Tax=Marchantia polymorpha subsp. ruderalis TaxID=1480154 RepID=A0A176VEW3_MARPO|nr:hypothetical protein AXG93_698s1090 [Marchantia polymorpha subsp. ruderalis]
MEGSVAQCGVLYPDTDGREEWSQKKSQQWATWAQFVVPPASDGPIVASGQEIRQAAVQDPYHAYLYAALVTPENTADVTVGGHGGIPPVKPVFDALTPAELQRNPAHKWPIKKVEDCNAYVGTLETFIEERDLTEDVEAYTGDAYASKEYGRAPGAWEVDMRDEFPLLFTPRKEARLKLPFSQRVENCGDVAPGQFRPGRTSKCTVCHGRGLIAHHDGSDTECQRCQGRGSLFCFHCNSRGLVKCLKCDGHGALLYSRTLIVRWSTLVNKKVSASSYAASVPDDVFNEASTVQLYANQANQCKPVIFPNSYGLSKLSADLFTYNSPIPPAARVICQRHQLRMNPVTRVVMADGEKSFEFFVVGLGKEIYLKNYPNGCSGFCCCLQMCAIS